MLSLMAIFGTSVLVSLLGSKDLTHVSELIICRMSVQLGEESLRFDWTNKTIWERYFCLSSVLSPLLKVHGLYNRECSMMIMTVLALVRFLSTK